MTESSDNLESRLAALSPRAISSRLESRISEAATLPPPTRVAKGFFWTTVAGGALAASTILTLLISQAAATGHSGPSDVALSNVPAGLSPVTAFASADWRWGDELNLTLDRRIP